MRLLSIALLTVVLALAACGDDAGLSSSESLTGRTFLSTSVTGRDLVADTRIRLQFRDDGEVGAGAGCNQLFGRLELADDRLFVNDMGGTEMGCDAERHAQDEWLMAFLGDGPDYELDGDRLRLSLEGTEVVLVDREVADPDRPLEGTAWALDGMIDGDAVSSLPLGVDGTVRFADGRVEVQVCNQGGTEVTVTDGELEIGELVMTDMACEDDRMTVERAVVGVLDGTITYEIEASVLTLIHPDGHGIILRATG